MAKTILFDLDGTIIDSQEGITNSVKYALASIGKEESDMDKLRRFIGPPLDYSFKNEYGVDDDTARALIVKYRERYEPIGAYESKLYPTVKENLKALKDKGYRLGIASSKPEIFCKKILDYLEVSSYFDHITGAGDGEERNTKAKVVLAAIDRFNTTREDTVLIGDTRFDVAGAREAGVPCIGITYGFGSREELEGEGAAEVLDTLEEVVRYIDGE